MAQWQDSETLVLWITIVFLIVLLLGVAIVVFIQMHVKRMIIAQEKLSAEKIKHQKELLDSSVKVQERERERIASDLHDELIGKLNIILLASASQRTEVDTKKMLQDSIDIARRISHDLSPPLLEETSLAEWIRDMVLPLKEFYTVILTITEESSLLISKDVKLQLIRIIQEVINNCIKHAKATQMAFTLRETKKYIALKITDNGVGFKTIEKPEGLGLRNIELRMQLLNGTYKLTSSKEDGTSLVLLVKFPIA
ncbi:ATP-binding protein [uncultured Dokdonia sp.]|uniref:sensor histidine kinase n=1 Tax=uncultured Dokdonia sp. TaxID=575653 RepID=UPI00260AECA6|nr:ATP-binding protein [uncultured Dokdonia sp.]